MRFTQAHLSASLQNLEKAAEANRRRYEEREKTFFTCENCGIPVICKPSHVTKKSYCSKACMAEGYKTRLAAEANPNYRGAGIRTCEQCDAVFTHYSKRRRYCSDSCANVERRKRMRALAHSQRLPMGVCNKCGSATLPRRKFCTACNPNIKKHRFCVICNTEIVGSRPKYCSKECRPKAPAPLSTCSKCGDAVAGYKRKYCDYCWRQSMMRGRRTDANQSEIVAALRQAGCAVVDASRMGKGFPDLIVSRSGLKPGQAFLLEVKTEKGKLNALQRKWHSEWKGHVAVVRSIDDALRAVGLIE